ncbi:hypothetical protein ACHHYP_08343 [Achlya hypogyna]|uniref:PDZ domain-containing protein n=1 Tax=Achlya hypogyna TaxID=1202772 RepID=A0A1V9ZKW8_ACHHY|nr:hypothetical protein ACHHYP_08343 [Achlya hypogyna]
MTTTAPEAKPSAKDHGDDIITVTFPDGGDLGIRIDVNTVGQVTVKAIQPTKGPVEMAYPDLSPGDVLVAINSTSVLPYSFTDIMRMLRDAKSASAPMQLTFLPAGTTSAEKAVKTWLRDEETYLNDGEFEVVFPPNEPLGFRLDTSFLMAKSYVLTHVDSPLQLSWARQVIGKCVVNINGFVVLGSPLDEVHSLLYSPEAAFYPKRLWLLRLTDSMHDAVDDNYDVVTIPSPDCMRHIHFAVSERMLEVPTIELAGSGRRSDGIARGQLVLAVNGVSALGVHADKTPGTSCVGMLCVALERLESESRSLLVRDVALYQREFHARRPLSPWRRRPWTTMEPALPSEATLQDVTISSHSRVLAEILKPQGAGTQPESCRPLGRGIRQKWTTPRLRHVQITDYSASRSLGVSFETDFSIKYTVFKAFDRSSFAHHACFTPKCRAVYPTTAKHVRVGDRIVALDGLAVESMETMAIVDFLRRSEGAPRFASSPC